MGAFVDRIQIPRSGNPYSICVEGIRRVLYCKVRSSTMASVDRCGRGTAKQLQPSMYCAHLTARQGNYCLSLPDTFPMTRLDRTQRLSQYNKSLRVARSTSYMPTSGPVRAYPITDPARQHIRIPPPRASDPSRHAPPSREARYTSLFTRAITWRAHARASSSASPSASTHRRVAAGRAVIGRGRSVPISLTHNHQEDVQEAEPCRCR